jgi:hypothetical protein
MRTAKTIINEFNDLQLIKCFEYKVIDKRTGKPDFIIFDISVEGDTFKAIHVGLTAEQESSDKIAYVSIVIDEDFSLSENLQELNAECITALMDSEFYTLSDN